MSGRIDFTGTLTTEWISVEDKMPLDDFFLKFPDTRFGIVTTVLVLINNEDEPNDDPVIVMLNFVVERDKNPQWQFLEGIPYHECHAANIKFWADVPNYNKRSVEKF